MWPKVFLEYYVEIWVFLLLGVFSNLPCRDLHMRSFKARITCFWKDESIYLFIYFFAVWPLILLKNRLLGLKQHLIQVWTVIWDLTYYLSLAQIGFNQSWHELLGQESRSIKQWLYRFLSLKKEARTFLWFLGAKKDVCYL